MIISHASVQPSMNWVRKKYFLNLEKSNKKKRCVRNFFTGEGKLTHDLKKVLKELESFYSNLYDAGNCADSMTVFSFVNDSIETPNLTEDLRCLRAN